jgi:nitrate reductase gamma subunit
MALSFLLGILPYITVGIFLSGILFRFRVWSRTPVPLRIVTTPGPKTRIGVAWRLIGDILWFPNLFKADKPLWVAGWCFHVLLWLVLLRHLRYFLYPVPGWIAGIQTIGLYAGYLIPIPLAFLLARRFLIDRTLYVSILGDYFALFLLLSITLAEPASPLFQDLSHRRQGSHQRTDPFQILGSGDALAFILHFLWSWPGLFPIQQAGAWRRTYFKSDPQPEITGSSSTLRIFL